MSVASAPSPLKPNAPAPSSVRSDKGNFAALLGSFHKEAPAPKKETEDEGKSQAKPAANEQPTLSPLPALELPATLKQEALPISLTLTLPVAVPTKLPADPPIDDPSEIAGGAKPASVKSEAQLTPGPASLLTPPLFPQIAAHIPAKAKPAGSLEMEKLTALQLPLKDSPKGSPHSEIAFEATLKSAQPEGTASPFKPPAQSSQLTVLSSPSTQREEVKTPDKPVTQETKPEHPTEGAASASVARITGTPHIESSPVKTMETPAISVSISHPDKLASPTPKTQTSTNASTLADLPELPAPRTEPARDISFRIASTLSDAVDVKLVDRAGQIHVAVRSADPLLTESLQANVTELAGKLGKAGYETETFLPNRAEPVQLPQQNAASYNFQQDRRAPQQEPQARKKPGAAPTEIFTLNPLQENA